MTAASLAAGTPTGGSSSAERGGGPLPYLRGSAAVASAAGAVLRCSPSTAHWSFNGLPERNLLLKKVLCYTSLNPFATRDGAALVRGWTGGQVPDGKPVRAGLGEALGRRCHTTAVSAVLATCGDLMTSLEAPKQLQKAIRMLESRDKVSRLC